MQNRKTELCKYYSLTNACPFEQFCFFAHDKSELVKKEYTFKNYNCKNFFNGYCPYGVRCKFSHKINKINRLNIFKLITKT